MSLHSSRDSDPPMLPASNCLTLDDIAERLGRIEINQHEIKTAVCGNRNFGQPGIIGEVAELKKVTVDLKLTQEQIDRKLFRFGTVMAVGWGAIMVIKDLFSFNGGGKP